MKVIVVVELEVFLLCVVDFELDVVFDGRVLVGIY